MVHNLSEDEIWLPVPNSNDEYWVSNKCRAKSVKDNVDNLIGIYRQTNGYLRITISVSGVATHILFHRILAMLFIPNPNNYPCVCHIDDNPSNCSLSNLEWGTFSHNTIQAYRTGRLSKKGSKNSMSKLSEIQVLDIHGLDISFKELAVRYHVSIGTIADIKQGLRWGWLTGGKAKQRDIRGAKSRSSLTNDIVMKIFDAKGTLHSIGSIYNISGATVWDIKNGKTWGWLTGKGVDFKV
jgi:hypothetical protein